MLTAEKGAWQTLAPSAIPSGEGQPMPREMTTQEIKDVIRAFAESSRRAARIGFDVIEMHAAHGYLVHQFQSPLSNKRTDDWGGDEERRLRFPLAVAEAMREATPKHVALGARINSTDFVDGGLTVEDAVRFAKELKARGFDYACVSSGNIVAGGRPASGPGFNIERAAQVKRESGILTRTVGFIAGPQMAEEAVASGAVDQVALARAFLDDPNWAIHAAERLGAKWEVSRHYGRVGQGAWPGAEASRAI
jgi:2,4-dienoyl-CoA reductase-like NADH-dependent reductase (Old Yellow Enzyme family)